MKTHRKQFLLIGFGIALVLLSLTLLLRTATADGDPDLSVSEGHRTVMPGDVAAFELTVTNQGTDDNFTVSLEYTNPHGEWNISTTADRIVADGGENETFYLFIKPLRLPDAPGAGNFTDVTVRVENSAGSQFDELTMRTYCDREHRIVSDGFPLESVSVGEILTRYLTIHNNGNGEENLEVMCEQSSVPAGWEVNITSPSFALDRDDSREVLVQVTVPGNAAQGRVVLEFTISGGETPITEEFQIDVEAYHRLEIIAMEESLSGEPRNTLEFPITIKNLGNSRVDVLLLFPTGLPTGWHHSWNPSSITLDAMGGSQDQRTIELEIDIGEADKAPVGSYPLIAKIVTSGAEASDEVSITAVVDSTYDVRLETDEGDPIGSGIKKVKPGESVIYAIEVINRGNDVDTFTVSKVEEENYATIYDSHTLDNEIGNITIESGQSRFIYCNVAIPAFDEAHDELKFEGGDKPVYSVTVQAKSEHDNLAESEMELTLNIEEVYGVEMDIPFPEKYDRLPETGTIEIEAEVTVTNTGNSEDDFTIEVVKDTLPSDYDWEYEFTGQGVEKSGDAYGFSLEALKDLSMTLTLTIDDSTKPGYYTEETGKAISVRVKSKGGTSKEDTRTVNLSLTKSNFAPRMEEITIDTLEINPADEIAVEYRFYVHNDGESEDSFRLKVETQLNTGRYKGWDIYFKTKTGQERREIVIPTDLEGGVTDIDDGDKYEVTFYVMVDEDEDPGDFDDIDITATSEQDTTSTDKGFFRCRVVRPNLQIEDDDIEIDPSKFIEEDDTIDVIVRAHNTGEADSGDFYAYLYPTKKDCQNDPDGTSSKLISRETVDNIPAGALQEIIFTVKMEKGENDFYVEVDKPIGSKDKGDVIEEAEYDNGARLPEEYRDAIHLMPDLRIEDIMWYPMKPGKGEEVSFVITIANNDGTADYEFTDKAKISLKVGTEWITSSSGSSITARIQTGQLDEMSFTWADGPDEWGAVYPVKVYIDFDDDRDRENNRAEETMDCRNRSSGSSMGGETNVGIFGDVENGGAAAMGVFIFGLVVGIVVMAMFVTYRTRKKEGNGSMGYDSSSRTGFGTGTSQPPTYPGKQMRDAHPVRTTMRQYPGKTPERRYPQKSHGTGSGEPQGRETATRQNGDHPGMSRGMIDWKAAKRAMSGGQGPPGESMPPDHPLDAVKAPDEPRPAAPDIEGKDDPGMDEADDPGKDEVSS